MTGLYAALSFHQQQLSSACGFPRAAKFLPGDVRWLIRLKPRRDSPVTLNHGEQAMSHKACQQNQHTQESIASTQNDIYSRITNKIISDLEQGDLTWRKPWHADHLTGHVMRPLRWNAIPYNGINTLVLWATTAEQGYRSPYWMTFKQAIDLKANIRKGEKGTQIVYADTFTKEEQSESGETLTQSIPFLKGYTVFNASQIVGLADGFYKTPEPIITNTEERNQQLEYFFAQTKADIHTGHQASYTQSTDRIHIPPFESFQNAASYYAVLAHELTHWTKHPMRLDRDFGRKHYGDPGYAKEELVAELGACFLAADLGFEPMPDMNHAAYIQSWLQALKDDKRLIFLAASHAQKAVDYVHALQGPR